MDLAKYVVRSVLNDESKGVQFVELENGPNLELKQNWYESIIEVGDSVAIGIDKSNSDSSQSDQNMSCDKLNESTCESNQQIITIETAKNFLVLNPDHLITSTELSNAGFCHRKTWLGTRFKFYGEPEYFALLGTLIHCLFQETISEENLTKQLLDVALLRLIKQPWVLRTLVVLNKSEENLIQNSREYVANIIRFNRKFSSNQPVVFDNNQPNLKIKINKVTDIEDTILAPNYGLKGKIDVTMNVELHDTREKEHKIITQLTPFELKTGKVSYSFAHQAQVSLYTLMIDNSSNKCDFGLLAYLKGDVSMKYIAMTRFVRNDLLMQRNDIVHHFKYLENGPKTRSNTSFCAKCDHLLDCCLMGELYEPDKLASFETFQPDLVPATLSHLDKKQLDFFKRWIDMIYLEEKSVQNYKDVFFWNRNAIDLEGIGRAIAKLSLHSIEHVSYEYKFRRADNYRNLGPLPVDIQFYRHADRITLSCENDEGKIEKIGFVNGVITCVDDNFVTVQLDDHIKEDHFAKIFRLDILAIQANFSVLYTSMLCLMNKESNSQFLRELIIDNRKPVFAPQSFLAHDSIIDLNSCQQKAVRKSLEAKDYLLIQGYPGCGKTETIVHLIKIFSKLNKTIVITAHTNQAVDNILLKLVRHGVRFMRIGNLSRIHPDLISYSEDYLIKTCTSTDEIRQLYSSINILAGTCYSLNSHMIFKIKLIDYCIVDEASQLNFAESLMPLFHSNKFILVGDPNQLTPIVNSKRARKAGYGQTLFEMLMQSEGSSVELTIQYRMNREIMRIANGCTYNQKLTCASEEIANSTLNLAGQFEMQFEQESEMSWIDRCLSANIDWSVLFLNTDDHTYSTDELNQGEGDIYNLFELKILVRIVNQLLDKSVPESEIGIISFYQHQVKMIKSSFVNNQNIEISTIDQYQGKDKCIILISCVKVSTNSSDVESMNGNGILNDSRRLNVAVTRSKKKLILVGSLTTLNKYEPFVKLFSCLRENQIIKI